MIRPNRRGRLATLLTLVITILDPASFLVSGLPRFREAPLGFSERHLDPVVTVERGAPESEVTGDPDGSRFMVKTWFGRRVNRLDRQIVEVGKQFFEIFIRVMVFEHGGVFLRRKGR